MSEVGELSALAGLPVLVTGAAGRIGSEVCARLSAAGAYVRGLVLDEQPGDLQVAEVVRGDACDEADVAAAVDGCAAVVHLAALISPHVAPFPVVFRTNVTATFNVLNRAGEQGITRAVIASSINANGLPYNSHPVLPAYWPIDEALPIDLDDPYSLSKHTDEHTARMVARHWGTTVVALRFPFTATAEAIREVSDRDAADPGRAVREGWSYLDVRDAARAVELALTRPVTGTHRLLVAADHVRVPYATEDLLDRFAPSVPRTRTFAGREVPLDLTRARVTLGFRAEHELDLPLRSLPDTSGSGWLR